MELWGGMKGTIYCFNTVADSRTYKAGHTTNKLQKRLSGYLGPSKPRSIIFCRSVENSAAAEKIMLRLMRQCASLVPREDLGDEWFQAIDEVDFSFRDNATNAVRTITRTFDFDTRHNQLQHIAKIVQLTIRAAKFPPSIPTNDEQSIKPESRDVSIRGFEHYFAQFDKFVQETDASAFQDANTLVMHYEASDYCPMNRFCEYLPHGRESRLKVVQNRYKRLLGKSVDL